VRVREDDGAAGRIRGAERRFEAASRTFEEELPHVGHRSGFYRLRGGNRSGRRHGGRVSRLCG